MNTKFLITMFACLNLIVPSAFAMGSKKPSTPAGSTPPSTPPQTPPTLPGENSLIPSLDFGNLIDRNAYLDASISIGSRVDDSQNDNELVGLQRALINHDVVDKCFDNDNTHEYFAHQISYYTQMMLEDTPAKVGFIGSYYGTSSDDSNYFPTSLIRHPLCEVSSDSLSKTINKVPAAATISKINSFAREINSLREDVLEGDLEAKEVLLGKWSTLFSCLAYAESLSTADGASSKNVANKVAPAGYRKPAGVKFYEDPAQNEASRLNIGMYQFTPNSGGNIQPCIRAWNEVHAQKSSCQVSQKASKNDLIQILGSSYQSFNAFCGVHKLIQTFAIQVNTTKTTATHPANVVNGKLKPYEARCVTPHIQAGKAYNHFGPFQNSTGTNLDKLFTCIQNN